MVVKHFGWFCDLGRGHTFSYVDRPLIWPHIGNPINPIGCCLLQTHSHNLNVRCPTQHQMAAKVYKKLVQEVKHRALVNWYSSHIVVSFKKHVTTKIELQGENIVKCHHEMSSQRHSPFNFPAVGEQHTRSCTLYSLINCHHSMRFVTTSSSPFPLLPSHSPLSLSLVQPHTGYARTQT